MGDSRLRLFGKKAKFLFRVAWNMGRAGVFLYTNSHAHQSVPGSFSGSNSYLA